MSEEAKPKTTTFADLVRFFEAVTPDVKCPCCGNGRWTVMLEDNNEQLASEACFGKEGSFSQYFPLYLTVCHKCGFVKAHHASVIIDWLKANPAKAPEQDQHGE